MEHCYRCSFSKLVKFKQVSRELGIMFQSFYDVCEIMFLEVSEDTMKMFQYFRILWCYIPDYNERAKRNIPRRDS